MDLNLCILSVNQATYFATAERGLQGSDGLNINVSGEKGP